MCSPHGCFFLVGDDQDLFVWGHPSLVDEAGAEVVAGEGEMDGRAHGAACDAARKGWAMADLWGGNGRWDETRSGREGPLKSSREGGRQLGALKYRSQGSICRASDSFRHLFI